MSVSETQICNLALVELGCGLISNIEADTSHKAVLCRLYLEPVIDEVLRSHEWNCAIWYQSLSLIASDDADYLLADYDKYSYQFQIPTNPFCLRVLEIPDYPGYAYEIVSGYLLTNLSAVTIKYIRRIENVTEFDSLLVRAIAYRLAADLATRITNSTKTRSEMLVIYDWQLTRAVDIDARESENPQTEEYSIRDAKDA